MNFLLTYAKNEFILRYVFTNLISDKFLILVKPNSQSEIKCIILELDPSAIIPKLLTYNSIPKYT